jgi:hypothetical protein
MLRELLGRPPRPAARPAAASTARLAGITGIRVQGDHAWAVVTLTYGRRRSGLAVELERAPGRFLVDAVQ